MTDNTTEQAAKTTKAAPPSRFATLVRGRVYYLREKVFERGVPTPVTPDEEAYLREKAVDEVTVEDENEFQARQKFTFSDTAEPQVNDGPRRRARSR